VTGRDRLVIVTLVGLLLAVTTAIAAPAFQSAPAARSSPSLVALKGYREGILGHPNQINPLTATNQADRDLVALIFSGLTRLGPDGTILPDLAERWTVDDKGLSYTFTLRSETTWQDGEPLTSADVVFTIETLQNPAYQGSAAASWAEVSVTAVDARTVRFGLASPVAGFLTATTQPLLPLHLLGGVPPAAWSANPFSQQPIGSGPFQLVSWDPLQANLVPAARTAAPGGSTGGSSGNPGASPSVGIPAPGATPSPRHVVPYLSSIELRFYTDASALAEAYRAGDLDAAVGLPPAMARDLGALPGSQLVRYPRSTLTGIILNLRVSHRELRDPRVRVALLQAIDRAGMIADVLAGNGTRAD
jgi:ABC-type transport system substrate-binding protein